MQSLAIIVVIGITVIAVGYLARRFYRAKLNPMLGGVVGTATGVAGSLLFMVPLNWCTFDPEYAEQSITTAFGIGLMIIGAGALTLTAGWIADGIAGRRAAVASTPGAFKGWLTPILLLAPTLTVLALFLYYPSLDTFRLSTLLARLGAPRTRFVCVDNFTRLVEDAGYLNSVVTTLFISAAIVFLSLGLALLIAAMVYLPIKGAAVYRTLLIWPYAISPAVAGVIFLLLFNPTGGIINYALDNLFGVQVPWLNNPAAAPWAVIIASVWKSLGYNILFYLAGLQNVSKDLLEAASIDGANALQRFRRIVIPMLSPITFFLVITNMTYAFFETFGTIDYLTGGGPLEATTTMMYNIYNVGIRNNDLGKAAAQSIVLFVLVIGFTVLQFRTAGQRVNYSA
jgi:sn-glycerol 3-phosphate transport system permease protein